MDFPATYNEIVEVIKLLKNKEAVGIDNIISECFKILVDYIIDPLMYSINKWFDNGIWPSCFKTSRGIPIYILHISKIFEKIYLTPFLKIVT